MHKILWLLLTFASLAQAMPPPEEFVGKVLAADIELQSHDLAADGLWSLPAAERMLWNGRVMELFGAGDINNGCDEESLRRAHGLMWMNLAQQSADAAAWKVNAEGVRTRLHEVDARLAAAQAKAPAHAEPRVAELERRVAADQEARNGLFNAKWSTVLAPSAEQAWSGVLGSRLWALDCENTAWLKQQLAEIGWFDIEKYGAAADKDAWLLVQHADRSKPFQRETLAMLEALPAGKTDPKNLAYLHDRVAMGEGRPQRYGTQGQCQPDGTWKPNPSEDPDRVDARRKAVGLPPVAEYALQFKDMCGAARR